MEISAIGLPLLGGAIIGLAAGTLLLVSGRLAGISSVFSGFLFPRSEDFWWRVYFLGGLVVGGLILVAAYPAAFPSRFEPSLAVMAVAGVLVGFGSRMGNGCTSGHGICGIGRVSVRSIAATVTFIFTGMVTVYVVNHLLGGL